jgi:hypothetical protein
MSTTHEKQNCKENPAAMIARVRIIYLISKPEELLPE